METVSKIYAIDANTGGHFIEYGIGYDSATGQVSLREIDGWKGEIRDLPLVVRDGRIYAEEENADG